MGSEDGQQQQQDLGQQICVICLSEISEACTARPCGHDHFDFLCLASWLQLKTTCPLCKSDVTEIHFDFADQAKKSYKTFKVPKIGLEPTTAGAPAPPRRQPRRRPRFGPSTHLPPASSSDPDLRARGVLARRRHVYRNRLYSLHVGSSPASRHRDVSPQLFNSDPDLLSRARGWIRRELQVFEFLHDVDSGSRSSEDGSSATSQDGRRRRQNNAEFVLEYVIAILKTVDVQESSGHAEELLSDFLGRDNCRLFLHELRSFLRSPYSMDAWDRHVQYDETRAAATMAPDPARQEEDEDRSQPGHRQRHAGNWYRPQRGRRQYGSRGPSRGDRWRPPGGTRIG